MRKNRNNVTERLFYALLEKENKALCSLQEAESVLMARYSAASDPESDDVTVEEYSRWFRIGWDAIEQARNRLAVLTMERSLVRQALLDEKDAELFSEKKGQ